MWHWVDYILQISYNPQTEQDLPFVPKLFCLENVTIMYYMYICMFGGMCLASYDHSIKVIAHIRNVLEMMNLVPRLSTH